MRELTNHATRAPAIEPLIAGAIDYAGLFPPAALSMVAAVRNYAEYRESRHAWALGRFVVPIARLDEFRDAAAPHLSGPTRPWRLSVLAGAAAADEWSRVDANAIPHVVMDAIELRARTAADIREAASRLPEELDVFLEIPIDREPAALIEAIAGAGRKAKVRTGGVTPDAFPSPADAARFIVECARAHVPFKATAGLHHPLAATYRLTYEANAPHGEMLGFINVLIGAALARAGADTDEVAELLTDGAIGSFRFDRGGVSWRGRWIDNEAIAESRRLLALSFGSCSFTEPISELEALGLL